MGELMKIVRKELIMNDICEIDGEIEREWIEECSDQLSFLENSRYYCYGKNDNLKYEIEKEWIEDTGVNFAIIKSYIDNLDYDKRVNLVIKTQVVPYDIIISFASNGTTESYTYKYPFTYINFYENTFDIFNGNVFNDNCSAYDENCYLFLLINKHIEKHKIIYNSLKDWFYGELSNEN